MSVPTRLLDMDFAGRLEGVSDPLELINQPAGEPARAINGNTDRRIDVASGE